MGYRVTPAWRGQYLPWGKGPTNYAPLPRPFTMKLPKGLAGALMANPKLPPSPTNLPLSGSAVDIATGNIYDSSGLIGNCATLSQWLVNPDCWSGGLPNAWKPQFPQIPATNYVPPTAPSQTQVAAALTCPDPTLSPEDCASLITQQANALVAALTAASVESTQAANSQTIASIVSSNQQATSGCDPLNDPLACLGGLAWYWWAAIAGGSVLLILALKR